MWKWQFYFQDKIKNSTGLKQTLFIILESWIRGYNCWMAGYITTKSLHNYFIVGPIKDIWNNVKWKNKET